LPVPWEQRLFSRKTVCPLDRSSRTEIRARRYR
jgi:hypothetical protein